MKRRSFLTGLLVTPILPHLPKTVEAVEPFAHNYCLDIDVPGPIMLDFETCAVDISKDPWHSGGTIAYRFPNHPVYPTKIARFCNGRD